MRRSSRRRALALVTACAVTAIGCDDKAKERAANVPSSAPSGGRAGAAAGASAAGASSAKGPSDPRLAELLSKALACRWDNAGPNPACDDARLWRDARDVFGQGRADDTLVAMLDDASDRVRQLAAQNLALYGVRARSDRALAEHVVRAAEAEKSERAGAAVGEAVARIDVEHTDLFERIRAMAVKHAVLPLRVAIVNELSHQNPGSSPAFTLTLDLLHDSDKPVRIAALSALWICSHRRPDEACSAWRERIDDSDAEIAARACDYLTWSGSCQSSYDALLTSEERRAKDARATDPLFAKALGNLCEDPKVAARDRDRATDLLKRLAQQKTTDRYVRAAALENVLRCDPGGRAYVARFAKDEDEYVKQKSTEILRPR